MISMDQFQRLGMCLTLAEYFEETGHKVSIQYKDGRSRLASRTSPDVVYSSGKGFLRSLVLDGKKASVKVLNRMFDIADGEYGKSGLYGVTI